MSLVPGYWPASDIPKKYRRQKKGGIGRLSMALVESLQGWHAPTNKHKKKIERQTI
jgi:hypothetical protein